jgi:hypothetical protein
MLAEKIYRERDQALSERLSVGFFAPRLFKQSEDLDENKWGLAFRQVVIRNDD